MSLKLLKCGVCIMCKCKHFSHCFLLPTSPCSWPLVLPFSEETGPGFPGIAQQIQKSNNIGKSVLTESPSFLFLTVLEWLKDFHGTVLLLWNRYFLIKKSSTVGLLISLLFVWNIRTVLLRLSPIIP